MKIWVAPTLAAAAIALAPTAAAADDNEVAHWHMDEDAGASVMVDSAPLDGANNGEIVDVTTGVPGLVSGNAYTFNGSTSYVRVPDSDALDPGTSPVTLTVTVRAVDAPMPDDSYDLVRKGYSTTKGGDWKLEIKRSLADHSVGYLNCVFTGVMPDGSRRAVKKVAKVDVVDGLVHQLQCVRTATAVQAVVDGNVFTNRHASGAISNDQPVFVGAKQAQDDELQGTLDEVIVAIG